MQVATGMTRNVITISPGTTLTEAQDIMRRRRFRHLPVLDGQRLVGMVTERDIWPAGRVDSDQAETFNRRTVASIMHGKLITIGPDDPLEEAARLLYEHKIGCLPVLDDGRMIGIITTTDIFHAFMRAIGALDPSTRIELRVADMPKTLTAVADVARHEHAVISGLLAERIEASGEQRLIVRFTTIQGARLVTALRAHGLDVIAPDAGIAEVRP